MNRRPDHSHSYIPLHTGDEKAFQDLYDQFAEPVYRYIFSRIRHKSISEEIVQEIFVSLWLRRETLEVTTSIESYLFGAAKYQILNHIRSESVRKKYAADFSLYLSEQTENSAETILALEDLETTIEQRISELPQKCQVAFRMSRMEHASIKAISKHMNISNRTVENYISRALKHLRTSLRGFLSLTLMLLFN